MSHRKELSEKITAAENGTGEIFDAYMSIWLNIPNISKEEIETFIARVEKINPGTIQTKAWSAMTQGMRYSLWPGTGNPFGKLMETIELFQRSNDKPGEGMAFAMLSLYYKNLGQLDMALECVNKAILYLKDDSKYLYYFGVAHFQGGEINQMLKDYDTALGFFNKGLSYFENDTGTFKGRLLSGIGNIYKDKNELEIAFDYFQKSLKYIEGKNHFMLETKNYSDIGNYYFRKGDYERSLEYQLKSLNIRKKLSQTSPLVTNYIELAELFLKQDKLEEALKNALLAETLAKEHNIIIKKYQADLIISTIYNAMGETALAFEYYKRYHNTKDQVMSQENARKIKQISMHHEMETMHKEKEIFKLRNVVLKEALDEIGASVRYAKRIQEAILPPIELVQSKFKDAFVLYKPKDVVAGDFYWMEELNDIIFIAAADCTGHGVPGALVSVVCSNSLNRVVYEHKLIDPGDILEKTAELVCKTFEKSAEEIMDGMDISLLAIDKKKRKIHWSGANNPLWYFENNVLREIAPVKRPIGKSDLSVPFKSHSIELSANATFYLFTDGFADQFGGPYGKKYKYKQLKEKLASIVNKNATEQHAELDAAFERWKGDLEQIDDVCIIGIKI
jgi:serine phosphatase RsbU (regulator of sigma subunit)